MNQHQLRGLLYQAHRKAFQEYCDAEGDEVLSEIEHFTPDIVRAGTPFAEKYRKSKKTTKPW